MPGGGDGLERPVVPVGEEAAVGAGDPGEHDPVQYRRIGVAPDRLRRATGGCRGQHLVVGSEPYQQPVPRTADGDGHQRDVRDAGGAPQGGTGRQRARDVADQAADVREAEVDRVRVERVPAGAHGRDVAHARRYDRGRHGVRAPAQRGGQSGADLDDRAVPVEPYRYLRHALRAHHDVQDGRLRG